MTDLIYVGIDPGLKGAIAAVRENGELDYVEDMPVADGWVAPALLREHTEDDRITIVAIEKVHAMPKQGVSSTFKFGDSVGVVRGAFALTHRTELIRPQEWKKTFGISGDDQKEQARALAIGRWPAHAELFKRKKDADRAEAALLAEHIRRKERGTE